MNVPATTEAEIAAYRAPRVRDEPEDDGRPPGRPQARARTVRASNVEPEDVSWLWEPRIPLGKLAELVGHPEAGKTTLLLDIAARVSRGLAMPDGAAGVGPAVVLFASAEDGIADTLRPRLDRAGADAERVHFLEGLEQHGALGGLDLRRPEHVAALAGRVDRLRPLLVVLDPLVAFIGRTDSYKDAEVRGVLAPLAALADRAGCAVVGIRHLTKGGRSAPSCAPPGRSGSRPRSARRCSPGNRRIRTPSTRWST